MKCYHKFRNARTGYPQCLLLLTEGDYMFSWDETHGSRAVKLTLCYFGDAHATRMRLESFIAGAGDLSLYWNCSEMGLFPTTLCAFCDHGYLVSFILSSNWQSTASVVRNIKTSYVLAQGSLRSHMFAPLLGHVFALWKHVWSSTSACFVCINSYYQLLDVIYFVNSNQTDSNSVGWHVSHRFAMF